MSKYPSLSFANSSRDIFHGDFLERSPERAIFARFGWTKHSEVIESTVIKRPETKIENYFQAVSKFLENSLF